MRGCVHAARMISTDSRTFHGNRHGDGDGRGMQASLLVVAEALFSDERGAPPKEALAQVTQDAVRLLSAASARARLLFRLSLFAVVWFAPLFVRKAPGLRRLPLSERVAALSAMEETPTGAALVLALKAVLCVLYYEQTDKLLAIGGEAPCVPGGRKRFPMAVMPPATGANAEGGVA